MSNGTQHNDKNPNMTKDDSIRADQFAMEYKRNFENSVDQ